MTNIFIMIFFGVALVIGIYFTWILLRNEMAGRNSIANALRDDSAEA